MNAGRQRLWRGLGMWWLIAMLGGCGPQLPPEQPDPNAPSTDAMSFNAMSFNALTLNRDPALRVSDTALRRVVDPDGHFVDVLRDDYALEFLQYLVTCALPADQSLTWEPAGEKALNWEGNLGLCPQWLDEAPSEHAGEWGSACQELVSSCMLAHVNAFGVSVPISVRGVDIEEHSLPLSPATESEFRWQEGSFYGNIFCPECVDPRLEIQMNAKVLSYIYRADEGSEPLKIDFDIPYDNDEGGPGSRRAWRERIHGTFAERLAGGERPYRGVIFQSMFACWSPDWAEGEAYTRERICAGPAGAAEGHCAAWPAGNCGAPSAGAACATERVCGVEDSAGRSRGDRIVTGDGDFDECLGEPAPQSRSGAQHTCEAVKKRAAWTSRRSWAYPLTVFLSDPCAIVRNRELCRVLEKRAPEPGAGDKRERERDGTQP